MPLISAASRIFPSEKSEKSEKFLDMFRTSLLRCRIVPGLKLNVHNIGIGSVISRATINKAVFTPQIRFNSTSSEIQNKLTQFTDEVATSTMTSDQIGYLDSIGMAQGYGPTAIIERTLEYMHAYTGLPWWGTIIATTIAIRFIMFPLYVKASANAAKMTKVKPELDQIMQDLKNAETPQEQVEATHARRKLLKTHDIHMSHQMFPIMQLPIAYGFFQALRKMANFPVEGFAEQGAYWFNDLTQVDPYLGLHVISASLVLGMIKLGGETGATQMNPAFKNVMYVLPIITILATKNFSAAVVLYFAVNSVFSFCQTMVLRNKHMRKLFKIPAIVKPVTANGTAAQPQSLGQWWREFNEKSLQAARNTTKKTDSKLGAVQRRRLVANKNFIKRH